MVLRSPITSRVGSPAYFLSCGAAPSEANWKMQLSAPMRVWPSITQCAPTLVPAPMHTCAPMTAYGPTVTEGSSCAAGSTMAVGWMVLTEPPRASPIGNTSIEDGATPTAWGATPVSMPSSPVVAMNFTPFPPTTGGVGAGAGV